MTMQNNFIAAKQIFFPIYRNTNYYMLVFKGLELSNQFFTNSLIILELQGSQQKGT